MHRIRKASQNFLNLVLWFVLTFYVFGGMQIHGKPKLTYINDLLIALAILYGVLRFSPLKTRFSETLFGNSWNQTCEAAIQVFQKKSLKPLKGLPFSCYPILGSGFYLLMLFFIIPILSYRYYGNSAFDLGVIENSIYNAAHSGNFFTYYLIRGDQPTLYFPNNRLNFGLIPFAAIYTVLPKTQILLFLQSLALISAMIPLYLLGKRILPPQIPRWVPLLIYWLWDPIHRMNSWDIHETPFMIPCVLWFFYFLELRKYGPMIVFLFLSALWREDAWWVMCGLSLFAALKTQKWTIFLPLALFGFLFFPMEIAWVNSVNTVGDRYPYLGSNLQSAISTLVTRPWVLISALIDHREYFWHLFMGSGGGVFLFSGWPLLTLVLPVAETSLSAVSANFLSHYVGLLAGSLFYCILQGWRVLYPWIAKKTSADGARAFLGLSLALSLSHLSASEPGGLTRLWASRSSVACYDRLTAMIPPDDPVLAIDPVAARLSKRKWISLPFPWVHLTAEEWKNVDQTGAKWLIADRKEFLKSGMKGKNPVTPWEIIAEDCGLFVAKRAEH